MKGGVYLRSDVEAYKAKRGDRKGGRYPKEKPSPHAEGAPVRRAMLGGYEGKGWMSDDFDEEMDEYGRFAGEEGSSTP